MEGKEVKSPLVSIWQIKEGREKMGLDDLLWFESKEEILNLTDHWGYCCSAFPSGWSPLKEKKRSFLCNAQKFN